MDGPLRSDENSGMWGLAGGSGTVGIHLKINLVPTIEVSSSPGGEQLGSRIGPGAMEPVNTD